MYDIVIRGGTVVDGTGAPKRTADVAIAGGLIVDVGARLGPARRDIDADGLLVTPGFVDIHTHYDGQATWDPSMTPSSWHGVTTTVFGNCGVGFAPVRKGSERYLINLMEGVEDIPEIVLAEGVAFNWESFPDYLDVLEQTPRIMDVGAQVAHAPLRFYVMGERGADHRALPSAEEIEEMGRLLEQALGAGALGFTTSRTIKHRAADGRPTPTLTAAEPELAGLARAMRRAGRGVIEVNSDLADNDFAHLRAAAELAGRPLSVLTVQMDVAPDRWKETLDNISAMAADGHEVTAQVHSRAIGVIMGLEGSVHPFLTSPVWTEDLAQRPHDERVARLKADPALRRRLVESLPRDEKYDEMALALKRTFDLGQPMDFEPEMSRSVAALAARAGKEAFAHALDMLLEEDGRRLLYHPFENYCAGDLSAVETMLKHPQAVCGVADGGAHVGLICDAAAPTTLLSFWARDRRRGARMPLEFLVRKQTALTARTFGLLDRGVLAPGYRADINVIDFDRLGVDHPRVVYDLPAGGKRLVQRGRGYVHTFVAGVETRCNDAETGARPGRLIRGATASPARAAA